MRVLKSINQGHLRGDRVAIRPLKGAKIGSLYTPEGSVQKSKWGTVVSVSPEVENLEAGDVVMYHENAATSFPFAFTQDGTTVMKEYDVTSERDLIYVIPKEEA